MASISPADVHVPSQQSRPSGSMAASSTMEELVEGLPFQSFSFENGGGGVVGAATPNLASPPTPNIQHPTLHPLPPHSPNIIPTQNISKPPPFVSSKHLQAPTPPLPLCRSPHACPGCTHPAHWHRPAGWKRQ